MRRYVFAYDLDTDAVMARRTLEDWVTFLSEDIDEGEITTWDDVFGVIVDSFIMGGDFTEFVSEADVDYPEEEL